MYHVIKYMNGLVLKKEVKMRQTRISHSIQELYVLSSRVETEGVTALKGEEESGRSKEKDKDQPKKKTDIEAKTVGLQIFAPESKPFPRQVSYKVLL